MRFSILKAGTATRAARERIGDVDRMFVKLLEFPGSRWEVHDVEHGVFPENIGDFDGFVITGGVASASDRDDWVLRLLDTLREAHSRAIPLLGICLGHQMVALAMGGEVGINPNGWDMRLASIELTAEGRGHPLLAAAPDPLRILETHRDIITRLPPGAVNLASSAKTAHEIFQLGPTILCLQGHPEMDNEELGEIIRRREKHLPPEVAAEGRASLAALPDREFLGELLQKFLRREGFGFDESLAGVG